MKDFIRHPVVIAVLILGALFGGIAFSPSKSPPRDSMGQPDVAMKVLDPALFQYANAWQTEIGRRFHGSVAVFAHGGQFVEGQWIVGTERIYGGHVEPMEDVIARVEKLFPGRTVVMLACNPDHVTIHGHPNVWYAKSNVWCLPDRSVPMPGFSFFKFRFATFGMGGEPAPSPHITIEDNRSVSEPDVVGNIFEFVNAE